MFSNKRLIQRTNKARALRETVEKEKIVFLSAPFGSGKTVLLRQLRSVCEGRLSVAWFDGAQDDWPAFAAALSNKPANLLIIDHLHLADADTLTAMGGFLNQLDGGTLVVMAGRQKMPSAFRALYVNGCLTVLTRDFLRFSLDEVIQLFLEYNITLDNPTATHLLENTNGFALALRLTAIKMMEHHDMTAFSLVPAVRHDLVQLMLTNVFFTLAPELQNLLLLLSPFERFNTQMAIAVTQNGAAGQLLLDLAETSCILDFDPPDSFSINELAREALCGRLAVVHGPQRMAELRLRAAAYYEQQNDILNALKEYQIVDSKENLRKLLIRNITQRAGSGFYIEALPYYLSLPEDEILSSPSLMQGLCILHSLTCNTRESERWHNELKGFCGRLAKDDPQRQAAQEALEYLNLVLPHRGNTYFLKRLLSISREREYISSSPWLNGVNIIGTSPSVINGGKDFTAWIPHASSLYRLIVRPIINTMGFFSTGIADLAWGEGLFETGREEDCSEAMRYVRMGLNESSANLETHFAAIGIQNRILVATGSIHQANELLRAYKKSLPAYAPYFLRKNAETLILHNQLLQGDTYAAINWLHNDAPNEKQSFIILDRYRYMLKLRLYIIEQRWNDARFLILQLKQYFFAYKRHYMFTQLRILEAIMLKATKAPQWQAVLKEALELAKRFQLTRVVADEGMAISEMLETIDFPDDAWFRAVRALTKTQAALYPRYMKPKRSRPLFTDKEYAIYQLLISGCRNAQIAKTLNLAECTVKLHVSRIYKKLGVSSRSEAVSCALELGDV